MKACQWKIEHWLNTSSDKHCYFLFAKLTYFFLIEVGSSSTNDFKQKIYLGFVFTTFFLTVSKKAFRLPHLLLIGDSASSQEIAHLSSLIIKRRTISVFGSFFKDVITQESSNKRCKVCFFDFNTFQ